MEDVKHISITALLCRNDPDPIELLKANEEAVQGEIPAFSCFRNVLRSTGGRYSSEAFLCNGNEEVCL